MKELTELKCTLFVFSFCLVTAARKVDVMTGALAAFVKDYGPSQK